MDLTIVLVLIGLAVLSILLGWLPILSTYGKLGFSAIASLTCFMLGLLMFNVTVVLTPETVLSSVSQSWANTTVLPAGSENLMNWTTTYTYLNSTTVATATLPDTYLVAPVFFLLGIVMFVRTVALPFVLMAEGVSRQLEEESEDLSEV